MFIPKLPLFSSSLYSGYVSTEHYPDSILPPPVAGTDSPMAASCLHRINCKKVKPKNLVLDSAHWYRHRDLILHCVLKFFQAP